MYDGKISSVCYSPLGRRGDRSSQTGKRKIIKVTRNDCVCSQVTRVSCYLTVVTLQYLIPILIILFSTLAFKALGKTDRCPPSPSHRTTRLSHDGLISMTWKYCISENCRL